MLLSSMTAQRHRAETTESLQVPVRGPRKSAWRGLESMILGQDVQQRFRAREQASILKNSETRRTAT